MFVFQAVWIFLFLPTYSGENLCHSELLIHSNITAELQSDILLPCNFHPTLLGSDKTADIAVVWTQKNTTTHSLLEIFLWGEVRFWDYKSGRIKTFPKLSESGNFSIVLQKVQLYDLSLYRCELFNGFNCSIAYQEINLYQCSTQSHQSIWIIVGAFTGGIVLLVVLATCWFHAKRRQKITPVEIDYENVAGAHSDRGRASIENPIYDTSSQSKSNACVRQSEEGLSSDIPVYATVKKVKKVNRT
ncbi:uncharacterized protein LOC124379534 [Silurus meridionalis]|uniref:Ig-like domain-containing protein n=1 Tax=Silurus meridionalis TaxID=175797 RepID=A0A8T0AC25_SILME|nr:uncharacterized protein LOC124379534 [Silurus meridionalis]KAF7688606.1 hypothetical protein HF521_013413 [Silurus meridionalis]